MGAKDDYARAVIAEGKRRGITPRGIQIGLATVDVESDFYMWANKKVPESLALPYDRIGSDGFSVGLFQQQIVRGANGWWWGDCATCMNPTLSAGLFFDRLAKLPYNDPGRSPGSFAQQIQQSAFPDRYDQRFAAAVDLYNRLEGGVVVDRPDFNEYAVWSPNSQSRSGAKIDLFLFHTEEGNSNADQLANGILSDPAPGGNPANAVSYHYTISMDAKDKGVTVCDVVDTDEASWSVGNANNRSINLCFAGSKAAWTRQQWLDNAGKAIDVAAYLAVQDCKKYGIPIKVVAPPYNSGAPGISDHNYVTVVLKWGSHTDVGPNFPWDVFTAAVNKYAGTGTVVTPGDPKPVEPTLADIYAYVRDIKAQLTGSPELGQYPGFKQLGDKTLIDAVASLMGGK
ncbi:metalloendopeptidase-like membrane protein [Mycobacteroides abscessus subsp. abscessus]|uniref:N-acetylmuramoyl-L-alanine amidase n=1 Tax=Mycobacteroides abscessus TaxID=36809 RepID=UPI0009273AD9|nr:N-acetylmuramoyl-L-alanine amidase [Mycobacteroides abscessus]SIL71495.1 metalloendopeptidase-like membrane protein [Mycobacteroides abscessus subsp. abscessus]